MVVLYGRIGHIRRPYQTAVTWADRRTKIRLPRAQWGGYHGDMDASFEQIQQSAMSLSDSERAELAASLIGSLDPQFDKNADEAWAAEIQRRIESLDNGEVNLIPWDDVIREMRNRG